MKPPETPPVIDRNTWIEIAQSYYKVVNDNRYSPANQWMARKELERICEKWNITVFEIHNHKED